MRNKIITSFFCLLLAVSALTGLVMPDWYYSEREKRTLAQKPKLTVADFISGEFSGELEKYLTDQVPLRDGWVTMKTYMELAAGKRESGGVYICKDKYLMDKFTSYSYSKKQLAANVEALAELQSKLAAEGVSMNTILVPMAAQVLTDKLPAHAPVTDYTAILQVLTDAGVDTTDMLSALAAHSSENIYYRTDHHWTSLGAYYAANALRSSWGLPEIDQATLTPEAVSDSFCGTLYSSSGFFWIAPDKMETLIAAPESSSVTRYETNGTEQTLPLYNYDKLTIKDKYTFFLGGNIPRAVVDTGIENAPSLLILRDSYADSLVPFMTDAFSEIHLIDLRYYTGSVREYIAENAVARVLLLYSTDNFCSDSSLRIF